MESVPPTKTADEYRPPMRPNPLQWVTWAIVFGAFGLLLSEIISPEVMVNRRAEAVFIVAAAVSVLASMIKELPAQNVLLAAGVVGVVGSFTNLLAAVWPLPLGAREYSEAGPRWVLVWAVLWILIVLTARGVGRLLLRPWRQSRHYGFWLIGLTVALALILDFGLELYAMHRRDFWHWRTVDYSWVWYGVPLIHCVVFMVSTLLILILATPLLIRKKPGDEQPGRGPLVIWVLLNLFFGTSAWLQGLRLVPGIIFLIGSVVVLRAARK